MGLGGVAVQLSGVSGATTTTDDNGQYAFTGLRMGNYSVEISGFDSDEVGFSNTAATVSVGVGESKIISFDGTYLRTAGIMGRVSVDGEGLENVTVSLAGGPDNTDMTTMTDAAGQYSFAKLRAGDYAVGISGYDTDDFEFEVTSQNVTVALGETATVPFVGVLLRTSGISGRVSVEGMGLAGIAVTLSMADADDMTAMTDAGGLYAFSGLAAGDYTVGIAVEGDAYVFDSMSEDVTVAEDMTAIVNFEGTHATTASVSGTVFIDELDNNDMMDEGEAPAAHAGIPVVLVGPGVNDQAPGATNEMGQFSFMGLKAGNYQLVFAGAAVLPEDFAYGGSPTGYAIELGVGEAAMQNIPIDITHTTVNFAVTLKGGEYRGMPVPGAMVTLYADAMGEDKVGEGETAAMGDHTGATSIRFARAGTTGNMVYAAVASDDYFVDPTADMQAVMWNPQSPVHPVDEVEVAPGVMAAVVLNDADVVNLNVDVTVGGATVMTEYGGGEALAGWVIGMMSGTDPTALEMVEGDDVPTMLDEDGMASFMRTVMPTDLPATYHFGVAPDQDNDLDGGENFEGTPVTYMHTGLSLMGTLDAGMIEVAYTTQTLKVYVHHERDQVHGYTGNVLGGDERMSGMIDVDVRYINDTGRSSAFPASAKIGKSDKDGVVTFTNVPADHRVVAVADEAEQDEEADDYQSVMLLDPDELAAYTSMEENGVMGGAFGPEGGFSHTVELCPLMGPNPSTQDHDECGSFAFVNTYQVSGLVWKVEVSKDDDDDFKELADPKFVDGINVSLDPVEGKNLAGDPESFTSAEENDKNTSFDDTHQFDFGAIAAGVYELSVEDGWRVRTPADDDELEHSPKGATGMVGNAFSPLAGDIALDVTPATGVLYGRVTDSDGVAAEGVTVDVNGQTDETDEFGRYIVEGFSAGEDEDGDDARIWTVSGEGITEDTDTLSGFTANAPMRFPITVVGAADVATISGTVTKSGTGDGVAGVRIAPSTMLLNPNAKSTGAKKNNIYVTDADGNYTIMVKAVDAGETVTVTATKKGMSFSPASHEFSALADSEVSGIDFTAFDHATITGRVLKDGSPVSGVKVTATLVGAEEPADDYTTRSTGTFRLSVPFGSYDIAATEVDHAFAPPDGGWRITVAPGTTVAFGDITATESDNHVPAFISDADFEVEEGEMDIGTVEAEDPDSEDVIEGFEILAGEDDGPDHGDITINAVSGELTFNVAPDEDEPADDDEDNVYEVTVQVTSGRNDRAKTAKQDITVTVGGVDEWEVTIVLTPDEISEAGGTSAVTATVSPASPTAFAVNVTVSGTEDDRTVEGSTLFFAADAEESTGTVEITAVNNNVHNEDVELTVGGTVVPSSLENITIPAYDEDEDVGEAKLTIKDDDVAPPMVTLSLRPSRIDEGETSELRVRLDKLYVDDQGLGADVTVTIAAANAVEGDERTGNVTISDNTVEIAAGALMPVDVDGNETFVTLTAPNNSAADGDWTFDISGDAGVDGVTAAEDVTLRVRDNDVAASAPRSLTITVGDATLTPEWISPSSWGSTHDGTDETTLTRGEYQYRVYETDGDVALEDDEGWSTGNTTSGTPITEFSVVTVDDTQDQATRTVTPTTLVNGTKYTVEVRGTNAAGPGAAASDTATPTS